MAGKIFCLFTTIFADRRIDIKVIILILIISILASFFFVYSIERKMSIRRKNRRDNNKGKLTYLTSILKEEK